MYRQLQILVLVVIVLFSCNKQKAGIEIDFSKKQQCKLSSIVDSVKTIQLETSSDCLIGKINAFYKDDGRLFIVDKRQKSIFIFSEEGNYINKICSVGRGKGEYMSTSAVCLDNFKKQFNIYDEYQEKIVTYNYNGDFIAERLFNDKMMMSSFCAFDNGHYLLMQPGYHPSYGNEIWEVDSLLNVVKVHKKHNPNYKFPLYHPNLFCGYGDKVSFYDYYENKIYCIAENVTKLIHTLGVKQEFPDDLKLEEYITDEVDHRFIKSERFYINWGMAEMSKYYVMKFGSNKFEDKDVTVFLRKSDLRMIITDSIINDFDNNIEINPKIFSFDKDAVCSFVFSETSEDNPKIQLYYLK